MGTKTDSAGKGSCGEEEEPLASQFHVLAVDDSIVDRKIMERLLKISSYRVTTVESGRKALQLLGLEKEPKPVNYGRQRQRLKVNMIIADYSMAEMTGYELLKTIKKSSAQKEIPVVVVSSEKVGARIDRCLEEGAEEFIVKPVKLSDVNRLKDHIVKALSKKQSTAAKRKTTPDNLKKLPTVRLGKRPRVA